MQIRPISYKHKSLRARTDGRVDVVGFFFAPTGADLPTDTGQRTIGNYPTLEAAQAAHPDAEHVVHIGGTVHSAAAHVALAG